MAFQEALIGKRERMSWIVEAAFGGGGTMSSGEIVGSNCVITPNWTRGFQEELTAGADNLLVQGRVKSGKFLPYTMTFNPVNWRWLKYLMAVVDDVDGAVKTHTFSVRNTILSWDLEWAKRHTTDHVITTVGNFMKKATINFRKPAGEGTEGHIQVVADCVAQDYSQGSSVTSLSNLSLNPFQFKDGKLTINSSEKAEFNGGSLTIDLGINEADVRYANSTLDEIIGEPIPGVFRISGRLNVNIFDKTFYDLWAAGVAVGGTNTLAIIRDEDTDDQIVFTFTGLIIHQAVAGTNLNGVDNVDLIITAYGLSAVARDAIAIY